MCLHVLLDAAAGLWLLRHAETSTNIDIVAFLNLPAYPFSLTLEDIHDVSGPLT